MNKNKEKCRICGDFGFYQNANLDWIGCPLCALKSDYERLVKNV